MTRTDFFHFHAYFCKKDTDMERIELPTVMLEVTVTCCMFRRAIKRCAITYNLYISALFGSVFLDKLRFYCNLI